ALFQSFLVIIGGLEPRITELRGVAGDTERTSRLPQKVANIGQSQRYVYGLRLAANIEKRRSPRGISHLQVMAGKCPNDRPNLILVSKVCKPATKEILVSEEPGGQDLVSKRLSSGIAWLCQQHCLER